MKDPIGSKILGSKTKLSLYQRLDTKLGGYLPFGVTPIQAKTTKYAVQAVQSQELLNSATDSNKRTLQLAQLHFDSRTALERANTQASADQGQAQKENEKMRDLTNTNFLERFGVGLSQEEKNYNATVEYLDYLKQMYPNVQAVGEQYNQLQATEARFPDASKALQAAVSNAPENKQTASNWLLYGAIAVGAYLLLTSRRK